MSRHSRMRRASPANSSGTVVGLAVLRVRDDDRHETRMVGRPLLTTRGTHLKSSSRDGSRKHVTNQYLYARPTTHSADRNGRVMGSDVVV